MIHMLNQVTNNMLLEHQKRQARSGGNQGYRQSLEKRLKCSVCHWWWDQSHIFLLRQLMVHAKLLQSCLTLCNPMDCSHQALLSMGFSRQEYRSGLPCLPPGDLLTQGLNLRQLMLLYKKRALSQQSLQLYSHALSETPPGQPCPSEMLKPGMCCHHRRQWGRPVALGPGHCVGLRLSSVMDHVEILTPIHWYLEMGSLGGN